LSMHSLAESVHETKSKKNALITAGNSAKKGLQNAHLHTHRLAHCHTGTGMCKLKMTTVENQRFGEMGLVPRLQWCQKSPHSKLVLLVDLLHKKNSACQTA